MVTAPAPAAPLRMPPALVPGDRVALFSPSSHAGRDGAAHLQVAHDTLSGWHLRPAPLPDPQPRHLYLAGTDAQRAAEFERLYCDPDVRALFATRGGWGAARMLPYLDATRIAAAPPKAVVGMSDVGALFAYLHTVAGVGAIHGPCLAAPNHLQSPQRAENLADLQALLFASARAELAPCTLLHAPAAPGAAAGRLVGGNLAVLSSLLGTPWALETAGCILFLEEVNEQPYRVDRMLTQLRLAGRLDRVAAVVFGQLQGCDGDPPGLLDAVLADFFHAAPCPVAVGLTAGHGARNRALPLGRMARLSWDDPAPGRPARLELP